MSLGDDAPAAPAVPAPETLAPGDVVDGVYRVERLLGEGGNGAVFLVNNLELGGARFALKVVHATYDRAAEALAREGRLAAMVASVHVVKVSALGRLPRGSRYLVMEYVEGPTLDRLIAERALTVAEVIDCGRQLCLALEAVHGQGLIHGDVSLRNVFATAQPDGRLHLQLGDFGLVRRTRSEGAGTVSVQLGNVHGTPRFMAPEVISNDDTDERADLFAVGVVLYRLLSGSFPFDGETNREVFTATLRGQPAPLPARGAGGALEAAVMRCLEQDPAARFAGARELRLALEAAPGTSVASARDAAAPGTDVSGPAGVGSLPAVAAVSTTPSMVSSPRRRWRWVAIGAVAAATAAAVVIAARRAGDQPRAASAPRAADEARATDQPRADVAPGATVAPPVRTRARAPERLVRFAIDKDDICLAVHRAGAAPALATARCDLVKNPPAQEWTIAPVEGTGDAVELRTADGQCLSWDKAPYIAACDRSPASTTRFVIRKRVNIGGNVWNLMSSPAAGPVRCVIRGKDGSADWAEGTDCDRWNEGTVIWRIEEVVPLERTTTVTMGGKCVSVVDGAAHSADFGVIELRPCNAKQLDQRWQPMPVIEDGVRTPFVQLRNAAKGLCLEVGGVDEYVEGSSIGIYMCDGGGLPRLDSHWRPVAVSATEHLLENRLKGLYATALGAQDGARFVVDQLNRDTDRQSFSAPGSFWAAAASR